MLKPLVYGGLGGINGAACMTILRLAARRAGLIHRMPPQALLDKSVGVADGRLDRQIADHAVHLGVGALGGVGYSVARMTGGPPVILGLVFGLAFWAFGFAVAMPLLGATRPPWRSRVRENAVNIVSHLVYGAATALVAEELSQESRRAVALVGRAAHTG
jgi:uncharacterized membrane protein YagU involved in acid resistance